jgi:hypothetical protein
MRQPEKHSQNRTARSGQSEWDRQEQNREGQNRENETVIGKDCEILFESDSSRVDSESRFAICFATVLWFTRFAFGEKNFVSLTSLVSLA